MDYKTSSFRTGPFSDLHKNGLVESVDEIIWCDQSYKTS